MCDFSLFNNGTGIGNNADKNTRFASVVKPCQELADERLKKYSDDIFKSFENIGKSVTFSLVRRKFI